ncbi:MAG: hypothetical protein HRU03_04000 [Nanoarchaeales archaeon]|nr:hypothetical protein [Nanoarchaeales archaeon]
MAKHVKHEYKSLSHLFEKEWRAISYVFLGVGLVLFLLNISSLLGLTLTFGEISYSYLSFDASVFASILLILYVVYNLTTTHKE